METTRNGQPRVVATGIGALTPVGSLDTFWEALKAGQSGIRGITHFDPADLDVKIAGEIDFQPRDYLNPKAARRMARASQMALVAAKMALTDAGLLQENLAKDGDSIGVVIGTVNAGFALLVDTAYDFTFRGRKPFPTALINGLPNMPGYYISLEVGATGPLSTISTACASGTQAIGLGLDLIRNRKVDMVIAGGVDCLIRKEVLAAFDAMTVVARNNQAAPEKASRPFDANRQGFVLSEGAGMLVLESLAQARARKVNIYAEVLGHAASSDAAHIAAPDVDGLGAQKAMRWALQDASIDPDQVDYINAHGTGTKLNDPTETKAIKQVFGQRAYEVPISSTKSMIGHCMGASGALEAISCIMAMKEGVVHPTINYETPDPDCDLDYVPNTARQKKIQITLSNSFGLGGQNACLVLGAI
jgi:beta-ketoacyl-acyl-carrier-protein synthase II